MVWPPTGPTKMQPAARGHWYCAHGGGGGMGGCWALKSILYSVLATKFESELQIQAQTYKSKPRLANTKPDMEMQTQNCILLFLIKIISKSMILSLVLPMALFLDSGTLPWTQSYKYTPDLQIQAQACKYNPDLQIQAQSSKHPRHANTSPSLQIQPGPANTSPELQIHHRPANTSPSLHIQPRPANTRPDQQIQAQSCKNKPKLPRPANTSPELQIHPRPTNTSPSLQIQAQSCKYIADLQIQAQAHSRVKNLSKSYQSHWFWASCLQ